MPERELTDYQRLCLDAAEVPGRPGHVMLDRDLIEQLLVEHERAWMTLRWLRGYAEELAAGSRARVAVGAVWRQLTGEAFARSQLAEAERWRLAPPPGSTWGPAESGLLESFSAGHPGNQPDART